MTIRNILTYLNPKIGKIAKGVLYLYFASSPLTEDLFDTILKLK